MQPHYLRNLAQQQREIYFERERQRQMGRQVIRDEFGSLEGNITTSAATGWATTDATFLGAGNATGTTPRPAWNDLEALSRLVDGRKLRLTPIDLDWLDEAFVAIDQSEANISLKLEHNGVAVVGQYGQDYYVWTVTWIELRQASSNILVAAVHFVEQSLGARPCPDTENDQ